MNNGEKLYTAELTKAVLMVPTTSLQGLELLDPSATSS